MFRKISITQHYMTYNMIENYTARFLTVVFDCIVHQFHHFIGLISHSRSHDPTPPPVSGLQGGFTMLLLRVDDPGFGGVRAPKTSWSRLNYYDIITSTSL